MSNRRRAVALSHGNKKSSPSAKSWNSGGKCPACRQAGPERAGKIPSPPNPQSFLPAIRSGEKFWKILLKDSLRKMF